MANSSVNMNVTLSSRGQLVASSGCALSPPLLTTNGGLPKTYNQIQPVLFFQGVNSNQATNPVLTTAANSTASVPAAAPGLTCTFTRFGNQVTVTIPTVVITTAANNVMVEAITTAIAAGTAAVVYTLPNDFRPLNQQIVYIPCSTAGVGMNGMVAIITTTGQLSFQTAVQGAALSAVFTNVAQTFGGAASSEFSFGYIAGA